MMGDKNPMESMMEMMSKMMGGGGPMGEGMSKMGMPMMDTMAKMMPRGLAMMLSRLPKETRIELAKEIVATIVEKGCEGLTEEERNAFFDDLVLELRPEEK